MSDKSAESLFKSLVWQNRYSRYAIICMLIAGLPVNIAHGVLELVAPAYQPITASIALLLILVALVLVFIAVRTAKPEQE